MEHQKQQETELQYRADLDGLRAVAVVPVVLYHLDIPQVPGGFVGVDVFFVLSGFFITRLICRDLAAGRFSLLGFYDRRIRRLFPALFTMLAFSAIAAWVLYVPNELERFGYELASAALSVSNFFFWLTSGYFSPDAETLPLLHTWTLAVEEQFYILFPLFLLFFWKYGIANLAVILGCLALASFALGIWGLTSYPTATFFLLPTRAWELALGCILALNVIPAPRSDWQRNAAALAGLVAIGLAVFLLSDEMPVPGFGALLPTLGSAAVIWAGLGAGPSNGPRSRDAHLVGRWLSLPVFVFIGLISYSLYLWHWPIIVFRKHAMPGDMDVSSTALLIAVIFVVSVANWMLIEQPMRSGTRIWPKRSQRFAWGAGSVATMCLVGALFIVGNGLPQRLPTAAVEVASYSKDSSPVRERCHMDGDGRRSFEAACVFGPKGAREVIVFADSHGAELSYALSELVSQHDMRVRQVTGSGCPPAFGYSHRKRPHCDRHVERMVAAMAELPPATVILTAFYLQWHQSDRKDEFWNGLEGVVEALRKAGHDVIILGGVPGNPDGRMPEALSKWLMTGRSAQSYGFKFDAGELRDVDRRIQRLAARKDVEYIPVQPFVCGAPIESGWCNALNDGVVIYFDEDHLTTTMARRVVRELILPRLMRGRGQGVD